MKRKEIFIEYLSFSRRDRIAILVIVLLIILVFLLPGFISRSSNSRSSPADTAWMASLREIERKESSNNNSRENDDENSPDYAYEKRKYQSSRKVELFYFDPNKLDAAGWERLGLRKKTIGTIQNYLIKGGKFRKAEDVKRIYGLFPDEYERIAPFIRIAINETVVKPATVEEDSKPVKTSRYSVIDINSADTAAFIALPGIGSKLSGRIVSFRDKLGGFYSIDQLGEVYGLADSTFQKIRQYLKLENSSLKKININTATVDELKAHPYIRYSLANPIIAYRNEHGPFSRTEDLKKVMTVTEAIFKKISPYLTIDK